MYIKKNCILPILSIRFENILIMYMWVLITTTNYHNLQIFCRAIWFVERFVISPKPRSVTKLVKCLCQFQFSADLSNDNQSIYLDLHFIGCFQRFSSLIVNKFRLNGCQRNDPRMIDATNYSLIHVLYIFDCQPFGNFCLISAKKAKRMYFPQCKETYDFSHTVYPNTGCPLIPFR